jgi:hypothetical protein
MIARLVEYKAGLSLLLSGSASGRIAMADKEID